MRVQGVIFTAVNSQYIPVVYFLGNDKSRMHCFLHYITVLMDNGMLLSEFVVKSHTLRIMGIMDLATVHMKCAIWDKVHRSLKA